MKTEAEIEVMLEEEEARMLPGRECSPVSTLVSGIWPPELFSKLLSL
jgi:hypothetical protein